MAQYAEKLLARIIVLREISENRDILFGPFNENRTFALKSRVWKSILTKAKSLGLVAASKDYKYLRDVYWQNIKRHSLSKRENEAKHGKPFKVTEIDELVFEVIDNTSWLHTIQPETQILKPVRVYGRPARYPTAPQVNHSIVTKTNDYAINESEANIQVTVEKLDELEHLTQLNEPFQQEDSQMKEYQLEERTDQQRSEMKIDTILIKDEPGDHSVSSNFQDTENKSNEHLQKMNDEELKTIKMQLEIKNLELQNYKTQLEVLQLERKLGIQPSKFTKDLTRHKKHVNIIYEDENGIEESEKWLTYELLKEEIMEKMRKLEEERHTVDLWSSGAQEWGKKRRKRQVTVQPPYVVYMLPDADIMEDWRLVRKLLERD